MTFTLDTLHSVQVSGFGESTSELTGMHRLGRSTVGMADHRFSTPLTCTGVKCINVNVIPGTSAWYSVILNLAIGMTTFLDLAGQQ